MNFLLSSSRKSFEVPRPLARTASFNGLTPQVCKLCDCELSNQPGDLRLSCRCLIHYNCLVKYILYSEKLEAKESLINRGIRCPFSFLPDEPAENTCKKTVDTGNLYFLTSTELHDLVTYGEFLKISTFRVRCSDTGIKDLYEFLATELGVTSEGDVLARLPEVAGRLVSHYGKNQQHTNRIQKFLSLIAVTSMNNENAPPHDENSVDQDNKSDNDSIANCQSDVVTTTTPHESNKMKLLSDTGENLTTVVLTREQVQLFEEWINGRLRVKVSSDKDLPAILLATTFPCPNCNFRETHYHGHDCHHVKNGCRNKMCKTWYCIKCRCTENMNVRAGRSAKHCSCEPTIFCQRFESSYDIEKYLVKNKYGYPCDSRCGCPICPDCRPGNPCDYCDQKNCAVCQDILQPGPTNLDVEWIAQTEEQKSRMKERDDLIARPSIVQQPLPSTAEFGPMGITITFLRNRLALMSNSTEILPVHVAGIADIETILTMLVDLNSHENSPTTGRVQEIAMLEARLEEQQAQLARLFDADNPDETTIQRLLDKIERTQNDISSGGVSKRRSSAPSIERFYSEVSRLARSSGSNLPSSRELQEYEQYASFISASGEDYTWRRPRARVFEDGRGRPGGAGGRGRGWTVRGGGRLQNVESDFRVFLPEPSTFNERGDQSRVDETPMNVASCTDECSNDHSSDGSCLRCGNAWSEHNGHECKDGQKGSWIKELVKETNTQINLNDLHRACADGHINQVKEIIDMVKSGPSILDRKDDLGRGAIHFAAAAGQLEVVMLLIKRGCDIELTDRRGWTALFEAIRGGHTKIVTALLDNGASTRRTDKQGHTPEEIALLNDKEGEILVLLRNKCSNVTDTIADATEKIGDSTKLSTLSVADKNFISQDAFLQVEYPSSSKFSHSGCTALRRVQHGNNVCESCGGRFRLCSGTYGYRDNGGVGIWRAGDCGPGLNYSSESPNSRWCSRLCQQHFHAIGVDSSSDTISNNNNSDVNSNRSSVNSISPTSRLNRANTNASSNNRTGARTQNRTTTRGGRCQQS